MRGHCNDVLLGRTNICIYIYMYTCISRYTYICMHIPVQKHIIYIYIT